MIWIEWNFLKIKNLFLLLIEVSYKYNPSIKHKTIIDDFLKEYLNRGSDNLTEKYVQGLKEIIGYLFTSGNEEEVLIFIVGIGGSGKSLLVIY